MRKGHLVSTLRTRIIAALLAVLALAIGSLAFAPAADAATARDVVITFTTAQGAQRAANEGEGAMVAPTVVSLRADASEIETMAHAPGVVAVEPDVDFHATDLATQPDDPCVTSTKGCGGIDAWQFGEIGMGALWGRTHGAGVTIAVIDGGIDATLPDLRAKMAEPEIDLSDAHDGPSDHGTSVAALAAAATDNGAGTAGIAWDSRILSVKVLDRTGTGRLSSVANGVVQATDHGARVINLSLSGQYTTALATAVQYAIDRGVVVVAAAGNDGTDTPTVQIDGGTLDGGYPARYPGVVAVGASTRGGTVAAFSNFGPWVDVFAPGTDLPVPVAGGGLSRFSGTSAAAPLVSGIAALLVSGAPTTRSPDVEAALRNSGTPLTGRPDAVQVSARGLAGTDALFPVGPNSPVGVIDGVGPAPGGVAVTGWTVDPDARDAIDIHTYVDGRFASLGHASSVRRDLDVAIPAWGGAHGFSVILPLAPGPHTVCIYGINIGAGDNALVRCVGATVLATPFGVIDGATRLGGVASLSGWVIDPRTTGSAQAQLLVDGIPVSSSVASVNRPDVLAAYPFFGGAHGFRFDVEVSSGPHNICVLASARPQEPAVGLGCRSI